MPRKNTHASAARLRTLSAEDRGAHAHGHGTKAQFHSAISQQHSYHHLEPMLNSRRRKRDILMHYFKRARDIHTWPPVYKIALFFAIAIAIWLFCISTAPPATPPKSVASSSSSRTTTSKDASSRTAGVSADSQRPPSSSLVSPLIVTASVVATLLHDPLSFTQGLLIASDGTVWESTGLYGRSRLEHRLLSGKLLESYSIPDDEFGEGLTLFNDRLIQLTWQSHIGYVYNSSNIASGPIQSFPYKTEGWGITHDGEKLIMSDGSASLFFMNPQTYEVERKLQVKWLKPGSAQDRYTSVHRLNELEYINGFIYANIWMTNYIVLIHPATGIVHKIIDATSLHPQPNNPEMTLNGIAWCEKTKKLFVTGKLWPMIYEIQYVGGATMKAEEGE